MKQVSYDAQNKTGNFAGGETLVLKFSQDEVGSLLHSIRTKGEWSFFHQYESETVSGTFQFFVNSKTKSEGFGLTVKKEGFLAKVSFTMGAAERLSQFLKFCLFHIFTGIYSVGVKQRKERKKVQEETVAKLSEPVVAPPVAELQTLESAVEETDLF